MVTIAGFAKSQNFVSIAERGAVAWWLHWEFSFWSILNMSGNRHCPPHCTISILMCSYSWGLHPWTQTISPTKVITQTEKNANFGPPKSITNAEVVYGIDEACMQWSLQIFVTDIVSSSSLEDTTHPWSWWKKFFCLGPKALWKPVLQCQSCRKWERCHAIS